MMVNVIGLGYIGLPTALMLATHGVEVTGTDYNKQLVDRLNAGLTTFKEKGLDKLFQKAVEQGIKFTTEYQTADTYIISVPTPYNSFTKKVDAKYVVEAFKDVLQACKPNATIVIESTISPGTIASQIQPIVDKPEFKAKRGINIVHAPERILPGNMVYELLHNNRTIGSDNREAAERVKNLYSSFCVGEIVLTDIRTAEMTKVVENTYRAVNIAFANELSRICHHDGMDVNEIIRICNKHPRVNIMNPGPGVGGHCISVDPWFLVGDYPQLTKMIGASLEVNASQPEYVMQRIRETMDERGIADYSRIGLYGMTYKENVDDFRDSPTLQLLDIQRRHLAAPLKCYDPYLESRQLSESQYSDFEQFLSDVDMVVVMVKHTHIQNNWDKLKDKVVLDCQNICPLPNSFRL